MNHYFLESATPAVICDTAGYLPGQLSDSNQINYWQGAPMAFPSTSLPAAATGMEFDRTGEGFLVFSFEEKEKTKTSQRRVSVQLAPHEGPTGARGYWQPGPPTAPPLYNPRSYSLAGVFGPLDTGSASEGTSVTMSSVAAASEGPTRPKDLGAHRTLAKHHQARQRTYRGARCLPRARRGSLRRGARRAP